MTTNATVHNEWEGDATKETSQKTCKTESKNCSLEESGSAQSWILITYWYGSKHLVAKGMHRYFWARSGLHRPFTDYGTSGKQRFVVYS